MRNGSLLAWLSLMVMSSLCVQIVSCLECFSNLTLGSTETETIASIKESLASGEEFDASCLSLLVQRGFYKAGSVLFEEYFLTNKIDIQESAMKVTQVQKRELERFISTIYSVNQSVQQIEPVIKWAQSEDHLFLHLKFSMRQDSPACLHCKIEKVEITNTTLFTSSFGIQSHQPLRFLANLTLFDEIDPTTSTWKQDSVGTLFFNLTKAGPKGLQLATPSESGSNPIEISDKQEEEGEKGEIDNNKQEAEVEIEGDLENSNENSNNKEIDMEDIEPTEPAVVVDSSTDETESKVIVTQATNVKTSVSGETENDTNSNLEGNAAASKDSKIWLRLEKQERKKDLAIWWDMRDRYKSAMDKWDQLCIKERENKKKNKNRSTTTTSTPQTSTSTPQKEDL